MNAISLDKIDHKIIQKLLEDGRASFSQIAREVNLTDVAIKKRVESLKRKGIIHSITANLNLKVVGYENPIFVFIRTDMSKQKDLIKRLSAMDSVIELHHLLGEYNLMAKIIVPNLTETEKVLNQLGMFDGVKDIKSQVVLNELKKTNSLPTLPFQKKL